jgi:hypothetical protein
MVSNILHDLYLWLNILKFYNNLLSISMTILHDCG